MDGSRPRHLPTGATDRTLIVLCGRRHGLFVFVSDTGANPSSDKFPHWSQRHVYEPECIPKLPGGPTDRLDGCAVWTDSDPICRWVNAEIC